MPKVHCQKCDLYMGSTKEEDFSVQLVCPICESTDADMRYMLETDYIPICEYPNETYMSWQAEVMSRECQDDQARVMVRLILEKRETDFFEFPVSLRERRQ